MVCAEQCDHMCVASEQQDVHTEGRAWLSSSPGIHCSESPQEVQESGLFSGDGRES